MATTETKKRRTSPPPGDLEGALHELGIELRRADERELQGMCPMHVKRTGKQDRHPSWSVNRATGMHNCLAGETPVVTWDGVRLIRDLADTKQRLLTPAGWVEAPVFSYGQQQLWCVRLSRNGVERVIRATADHRWMVDVSERAGGRRRKEVTTRNLLPNQRCTAVLPRRSGMLRPSIWGATHGAVFGDGTNYSGGSRITLFGEKTDLAYLFNRSNAAPTYESGGIFTGLPRSWKLLPNLDEASSYLYGWLAGYFATDGCVDTNGVPKLSSARRENLEFIRTLCLRIGVVTYGITEQARTGYGTEPTPLYSITFDRQSLTEAFFLRSKHRERWLAHKNAYARHRWTVVSVEPTNDVEEVYCAEVPEHGVFALDDQLLTGNCFSCGYGGSFLRLVMDLRFKNDAFRASRWIRRFGVDLDAVVSAVPTWDSRRAAVEPDEPDLDLAGLLASFEDPPAWALEKRCISAESAAHYGVRWDARKDAWILPIRRPDGALLGWQIKAQTGRLFRNFPVGVQKAQCLFGLDVFPAGEPAVLLESPLDVPRLHSAGLLGGLSTFGVEFTDVQLRLIADITDELIAAFDNDEAGWKANALLVYGDDERGRRPWTNQVNLWFLSYIGIPHKDIGDMDDAQIHRAINNARHWSELVTAPVTKRRGR